MISFTVPIRLVSEANMREHWTVKHRRKKAQQAAVVVCSYPAFRAFPAIKGKIICTLTRYGKRKMDSDNLAGAFKHVQDAVARLMAIDDGSDKIEWRYRQEKGEYAVSVQIEHNVQCVQ